MDNQIKIALLGDSYVGKTSIILKYIKNDFNEQEQPSIGNRYVCKKIVIDGTNYNLNIWDTAGTEKYNSVSK